MSDTSAVKSAIKTILFVENDPVSLAMYQNRLQREGFYVKTAQDGLGALKVLSGPAPDIVVLDLMLPRFSGSEVFKFIRTDPRLRNLPVIIFSNAAMSEWPQDISVGATQCLLKSDCTFPTLLQTISELLAAVAAGAIPAVRTDTAAPPTAPSKAQPAGAPSNIVVSLGNTAVSVAPEQPPPIKGKPDFVKAALAEVPKLREHCLAYIKAPASDAGKQHGARLNERVQSLSTTAAEVGCTEVAQLTKAFASLLAEITVKTSWMTPSVLQTIAQAVDCLNFLLEHSNDEIPATVARPKVLAVDDDPICNRVMVTTLKRANFDITSIESPISALQLLQSNRYDVVLLDVNMPDLTGFEVCNKLRQLSHCKTTPVVFITAFNNFENRKQSVLSGGDDFITKPVSPLELALKVTIHLLKSRVQRGNAPVMEPEAVPQSSSTSTPMASAIETTQSRNNETEKIRPQTLVVATTESGSTSGSNGDSRQTPPLAPDQSLARPAEEMLDPVRTNRINGLPAESETQNTTQSPRSLPTESRVEETPVTVSEPYQPTTEPAFAEAAVFHSDFVPANAQNTEQSSLAPATAEPFAVAISSDTLAPVDAPVQYEPAVMTETLQTASPSPDVAPAESQPFYDPSPESTVTRDPVPMAIESATSTASDNLPDFTSSSGEEIAITLAPESQPSEFAEPQITAQDAAEDANALPTIPESAEPFSEVIVQDTFSAPEPAADEQPVISMSPAETFSFTPEAESTSPVTSDVDAQAPAMEEPFAASLASSEQTSAAPASTEAPTQTYSPNTETDSVPAPAAAQVSPSEVLTINFGPAPTQSNIDQPDVFTQGQPQEFAPAPSETISDSQVENVDSLPTITESPANLFTAEESTPSVTPPASESSPFVPEEPLKFTRSPEAANISFASPDRPAEPPVTEFGQAEEAFFIDSSKSVPQDQTPVINPTPMVPVTDSKIERNGENSVASFASDTPVDAQPAVDSTPVPASNKFEPFTKVTAPAHTAAPAQARVQGQATTPDGNQTPMEPMTGSAIERSGVGSPAPFASEPPVDVQPVVDSTPISSTDKFEPFTEAAARAQAATPVQATSADTNQTPMEPMTGSAIERSGADSVAPFASEPPVDVQPVVDSTPISSTDKFEPFTKAATPAQATSADINQTPMEPMTGSAIERSGVDSTAPFASEPPVDAQPLVDSTPVPATDKFEPFTEAATPAQATAPEHAATPSLAAVSAQPESQAVGEPENTVFSTPPSLKVEPAKSESSVPESTSAPVQDSIEALPAEVSSQPSTLATQQELPRIADAENTVFCKAPVPATEPRSPEPSETTPSTSDPRQSDLPLISSAVEATNLTAPVAESTPAPAFVPAATAAARPASFPAASPAISAGGLTPEAVFEKIVDEVARLMFGETNLTPLNLRLVRMSLEKQNIHGLLRDLAKK